MGFFIFINMKNEIRKILREGLSSDQLLDEADNRKKIIKFGGTPELADWAHNISNKYSVWIANGALKQDKWFNTDKNRRNDWEPYVREYIDFIKTPNKPPIDLKNSDWRDVDNYMETYQYISDWIDNPNVPYVDLTQMTWQEAEQRATEWHDSLEAGGEVENILGDNSEIIHKFPDGYSWVLTKSHYCDKSQASMGHCATASREDMYLLRLIKGKEEFITADWHPQDEYIMQLKGKGNSKPIPKYHPYILWLLGDSGMVDELKTDEGFRPETNFQLTDLSTEQAITLLNKNPYLFYSDEIYRIIINSENDVETIGKLSPKAQNRLDGYYLSTLIRHSKNPEEFQKAIHPEVSKKHFAQPVNENRIKKILREGILTKTENDIHKVADFVNFAKKFLGIDDNIQIALAYEKTPDIKTTAYYNLDGFIKVYVKDRAIMDVCRSIAHELTHHKQNLEGRLTDAIKDGEDGSDLENEANAKAGEIIRKWGKIHPEIYI